MQCCRSECGETRLTKFPPWGERERERDRQADFTACRHQYKKCGGFVNTNNTDDQYLLQALKESGSRVSSHGRSVGDHASCSNMFDHDLQEMVMHHERHLVREFNLGSCCP